MKDLQEQLEKSNVKVVFGLEAQGHIPTIEAEINRWNELYKSKYPNEPLNNVYSKHVWECIGKTIGWEPFTAALYYFEYLSKKADLTGEELNVSKLI